jgi:endonuclease-3
VILQRLRAAYTASTVALEASNPLEMLIATILSAQCTDARVNEVTKTLFRKYRRPEDYLAVPEEELREDIRSTGFFNQKARSVRGTCRRLVEVYGGEVPDTMEDLLTLPGVARKTANVVLGNSFGKVEGIAVDTHVRRLSQRFGFSTTDDPVQIERDLMALLPKADWFDATYRFVDHGRTVCTARSPKCGDCPVEDLCPASQA